MNQGFSYVSAIGMLLSRGWIYLEHIDVSTGQLYWRHKSVARIAETYGEDQC